MLTSIKAYFALFNRYLAADLPSFFLLCGITLLSLGLRLYAPQWLRFYVDGVGIGQTAEELMRIALIFSLLSLLRHGSMIAYRMLSEVTGLKATDALRRDVVEHCLALDLSYHKDHTPGEMISRLDHDVNQVAGFFARFWSGILVSFLALFGAIAVIFYEVPLLGGILSLSTGMSLWGMLKIKDATLPYIESNLPRMALHYGNMEEHFTAAEDLRANGALAYTMKRFHETLAYWKTSHRDSYLAFMTLHSSMQLFFGLNTILTFAFCMFYWQQGLMQVGTAFMLVNYSEQLRGPINDLRMRFVDLQRAEASLHRLQETLDVEPSIKDEGVISIFPKAPHLAFSRVSFAYDPEIKVLDDLSFTIAPGQVLGLLGRSGSGKSSLVRLLLRFYEHQEGAITLDGHEIAQYPLQDLRRSIAYVTQEVQLFKASLRHNLNFFDDSISDEQILTALDNLGLTTWYKQLPKGLDSVFSENFGLSAGESQLLALTRAFLRNPSLVILDEASARLDPLTEQQVAHGIDRLLANRTGIIIAHRLHTLERVDQLLILDKGKIVEQGKYRDLADNSSSHFASLLRQAEVII